MMELSRPLFRTLVQTIGELIVRSTPEIEEETYTYQLLPPFQFVYLLSFSICLKKNIFSFLATH